MSNKNDSPNNRKVTPPTKGKVRNPFDKALIEKLHKPICSPGMCKIYKKKSRGAFRWDIDQACTLIPADIVACNSQFEPSPDPALEKIAEEANDRFFSQEMVMPSPMETSKKIKPLQTSLETSIEITSFVKEAVVTRDVSAQTVLTLPPKLPPELEIMLQPFCTYTQDQNQDIFDEYEITANGSLRRKLFFEERDNDHSDDEQYDSEHTDDETHVETRPSSSYEDHTPVIISPNLSCNQVMKGMKRTFGTPLQKGQSKLCYRNKILEVVEFESCLSPIEFTTPKRNVTSTLASISPLTKTSSDEEKNFTSPECEAMATCLSCIVSEPDSGRKSCFCKITPTKIILKRSTSLKHSPHRRKGSLSEKRSLSMSSLNRSRSVQKLDFSMDMSTDGSVHDKSQESSPKTKATWSIIEDSSINLKDCKESNEVQSSTKIFSVNMLDDTPIKGKRKTSVTHEISKIRAPVTLTPLNMSLDNSLDNFDIPLSMEDRKIDFNSVDLKFLTDNVSQLENKTECSIFKRVDSGFNENTLYSSSYYESAIKPSELTTNTSKALKEISNTNWMRVDSGFNETDSIQFYTGSDYKRVPYRSGLADKENIEEQDRHTNRHEPMSISDFMTEDLTFNCNFSSTPSKTKARKVNS